MEVASSRRPNTTTKKNIQATLLILLMNTFIKIIIAIKHSLNVINEHVYYSSNKGFSFIFMLSV